MPALALAARPTLPMLLAAGFLAGVAIEQFGVAWDISLQRHVPPDRLARVCSYDMLGSFLAIPAGQIAVGPLAAAVGVQTTLLASAAIILLATAVAASSSSVQHVTSETRRVTSRAGPSCPAGNVVRADASGVDAAVWRGPNSPNEPPSGGKA